MNQLFFLVCLSVSVWAFSYWLWLSATDYETAAFWVRMLSIGSLFIPIFYFHWCITLLKINLRLWYIVHAAYIAAAVFLALSSSPLFIRELKPALFFLFWPRAGVLYTAYLVSMYFGLVLYAVVLMARHYRQATNEERGRIAYILMGTLFGFGGGAMNFFLWYDIPVVPSAIIRWGFFRFFFA